MTQCGTPMYMSPEVFEGIPYTDKTDVYSLGILMFEMAHMDKQGILPQIILFKIIHNTLPTMPTDYSKGVTDLLAEMIRKDPNQRPSAGEILSREVFKTAKKPPPLPPRGERDLEDVDDEDRDDKDMRTIIGTLTQLHMNDGQQTHGGGAARFLENLEGHVDFGTAEGEHEDEFEDNPVMQLVTRTMMAMGQNTVRVLQGRSSLEKQLEMLEKYCLHCLDDNVALFNSACDALDKSQNEEEIEETLIRIIGHEKYGLCGVQLLHYKNFLFNLQS